jgi:low affinity Fe/Cu permease
MTPVGLVTWRNCARKYADAARSAVNDRATHHSGVPSMAQSQASPQRTPAGETAPFRSNAPLERESHGISDVFSNASRHISRLLGSAWAFMAAVAVIVVWALSGPAFGFSDTWQLVINTSTTIVTFLMVFLIQNTQNRDSLSIQLKLDELLASLPQPRTNLVDLEDLPEAELKRLENEFAALAETNPDQLTKSESAARRK